MTAPTEARLTTDLARFLRQVNEAHVTYDPETRQSWLKTSDMTAPADRTHLANVADLADFIDVAEAGGKWSLTDAGRDALAKPGGRA